MTTQGIYPTYQVAYTRRLKTLPQKLRTAVRANLNQTNIIYIQDVGNHLKYSLENFVQDFTKMCYESYALITELDDDELIKCTGLEACCLPPTQITPQYMTNIHSIDEEVKNGVKINIIIPVIKDKSNLLMYISSMALQFKVYEYPFIEVTIVKGKYGQVDETFKLKIKDAGGLEEI